MLRQSTGTSTNVLVSNFLQTFQFEFNVHNWLLVPDTGITSFHLRYRGTSRDCTTVFSTKSLLPATLRITHTARP